MNRDISIIRKKNKLGISETVLRVLTVALYASFFVFESSSLGKYIYILLSVAIFIIDAVQQKWRFGGTIDVYHVVTIVFLLFVFFSTAWALDYTYTLKRLTTMLGTVFCLFLVFGHYRRIGDADCLFDIMMWAGFVLSAYSIAYYGLSPIQNIILMGERAGNDFANINSIGICATTSLLILFAKVTEKRFSPLYICALPAVVMVLASGSRKALIALVLGAFLIMALRAVFDETKSITGVLKAFVGFAALAIFLSFAASSALLSPVLGRMDTFLNLFSDMGSVDESTLRRMAFIELGIEQWLDAPLLGIGIGNSIYCRVDRWKTGRN